MNVDVDDRSLGRGCVDMDSDEKGGNSSSHTLAPLCAHVSVWCCSCCSSRAGEASDGVQKTRKKRKKLSTLGGAGRPSLNALSSASTPNPNQQIVLSTSISKYHLPLKYPISVFTPPLNPRLMSVNNPSYLPGFLLL